MQELSALERWRRNKVAERKRRSVANRKLAIGELSSSQQDEYSLSLLMSSLVMSGNISAMVYGVLVYIAYRDSEVNTYKNFGEQFANDLEKIYVNDLHSNNPEAAYLYKEQLRFLIEKHGLDPLETSGVEPLQSNFNLAPTFLELYGPIDKELQLVQAVLKAKRKKVKEYKRNIDVVKSARYKELKASLRETLRDETTKYGKVDGRRIPLTKVNGKEMSVYSRKEKLRQARLRQDKRNALFDNDVPLVKIEYYTTRRKRSHLLESDREILQAMGQWRVADERRFPTDDNVEVERISSSKVVQAFVRKQRSKRLLHRPQHQNKASPQK